MSDKRALTLPKARRVRRRADFLRAQGGGARVPTPPMLFLVAALEAPGPTRLGVTVTRKYGCAVERNRAKRLVREAFRTHPELVPPGVDLVVIVRDAMRGLGLADVVGAFRSAGPRLARRATEVRAAAAAGA